MLIKNNISIKQSLYSSVSDSILLPRLIQLEENLFVAAFSVMKLLPAKEMIVQAIKQGDVHAESIVVDTSSGTFALGLGMICAEHHLPFRIFGDPAIDEDMVRRLCDLGGEVHISRNPKNPGAYQAMRLVALKAFLADNPQSFWAHQYDNVNNTNAYKIVGEQLLEALSFPFHLVGPVGSGGSTGGIIKTVRAYRQEAKLIGVDTFNSVLFGLQDGKRVLRGLGNSIMPKNLDHTCYDEVHWVSANDAFQLTRELFRKYALFSGPTTGAAFQVARFLAQQNRKENYIFISPDEGYRYIDTIYNDAWLKNESFYVPALTAAPIEVVHPSEAQEAWSFIRWDRRSYQDVLGVEYVEAN